VSEHTALRRSKHGEPRTARRAGQPQPARDASGPARHTIWPVRSGTVPFTDRGFTPRPETGQGPWDALRPGTTVILGPAGPSAAGRPAGPGGTGKTHLAAAFAARLWATDQLDLLVWLAAGSRDSIVAGYAQALAGIRVAAAPGQPEAAADRFLAWLAATGRRWLVVLDGLADPADLDGLWPHGPAGQVLVTTGQPGVSPPQPAGEHLAIGLPAFSQREALRYLSDRLSDDHYQLAGSLDVAFGLGCLPAGLDLACAYLQESGQDTRQYRLACERYRPQDGQPATDLLGPAWMVAVGRAVQLAPSGQAWPALKLAAVLGPAGIPGTILTSPAAAGYVTGQARVTEADQLGVQAAYGNLEQFGLIRITAEDVARTVWAPAALQQSVLQAMGAPERRRTVLVAADAILGTWPAAGPAAGTVVGTAAASLEQAYRDCAASVLRWGGPELWEGGPHPLLARAGQSLDDDRMTECALSYWRELATRSSDHLGARSAVTLQFRERMARAAVAAGHADEAIALFKELVADTEETAGPGREQAIAVRASLALAYRAAGRLEDSISLAERVAAECERTFGPGRPPTAQSLHALGEAYASAGRDSEAAAALSRCLAARERAAGLMQPGTIAVRQQLAELYRRAGHADEAIGLYQEALARVVKAAGPAYPDAVIAREHLAAAYDLAGRAELAATTFAQAITEWERVPGSGPGNTFAARASLAALNCRAGRLRTAFPLYEGVLADLYQVSGPGHPDTLRARWNVAAVYHKARRLPDAIGLGEAVLADCERFLGPGHWETLSTRANLAHAYHSAGKLKRSSAQFDRALRDCERALGADDPLTGEVRVLRNRYLAGRQGAAPIITAPAAWIRASQQGRGSGQGSAGDWPAGLQL
jgi:tetratricopeptide (TPR) repeat protein